MTDRQPDLGASASDRIRNQIGAAAARRARTAADRARRKLARDHGLRARHRDKLRRLAADPTATTREEGQ